MKECRVYQCEYCRRIRFTKKVMERHEKECVHNPKSVNCYRCKRAYRGEAHDDYDRIFPDQPCCSYTEDEIVERLADGCEMFERSETMWYTRTEPEVEVNG